MRKSPLDIGKALIGRIASAESTQGTRSRREFYCFPWASPRVAKAGNELLISVILPVYNHARFLPAALQSILTQKRPALEIVIIDDGSTDDLESAVKPHLEDTRISLYRQPNQGLASALNAGLCAARGDLLTWTSADNLYRGEALAEMADFLIANAGVGLVYANVELINDAGELLSGGSAYRPQDQDPKNRALLKLPVSADTLANWHDNFINACFLFRREVSWQTGLYKPQLKNVEDFDYWLRTTLSMRAAHLDSDEAFYRYRIHGDSMTGRADSRELEAQAEAVSRSFRLRRKAARSVELAARTGADGSEPLLRLRELLGAEHLLRAAESYSAAAAAALEPGVLIVEAYTADGFGEPLGRVELRTLDHPAFPSSPLVCGALSPARPLIVHNPESAAAGIIPPELLPLTILKRARDGDFEAIQCKPGSRASVLSLVQTGPNAGRWSATTSELVRRFNDFTFTLFAHTTEERAAADDVNRQTDFADNLRIIDCSAELAKSDRFDFVPLMYALSSADALLSVHCGQDHYAALHELLGELALAALSGRNLISITDFSVERRPGLGSVPSGDLSGTYLSSLAAELRAAPHIVTVSAEKPAEFRSAVERAIRPTAVCSLEQWLERYGREGLAKRLFAVLNSQ